MSALCWFVLPPSGEHILLMVICTYMYIWMVYSTIHTTAKAPKWTDTSLNTKQNNII